jgi:hypothetical protein
MTNEAADCAEDLEKRAREEVNRRLDSKET